MPFALHVAPHLRLPGAINIVVEGDPNVVSALARVDGALAQQPVRNYKNTGPQMGTPETVTDCDAPLGRPVRYNLLNAYGDILATSRDVTAPQLPNNRALLRNVTTPHVSWMTCEPQDEKGVQWVTQTASHYVLGSSEPVVVGETMQRHKGTMTFLCRSIEEADQMVRLLRPGEAMSLRHDPCAQMQTRDITFMVMGSVDEVRYGRSGWRLLAVDYQSVAWVAGDTVEPVFDEGWDFQALTDSAPDFSTQASLWPSFKLQVLLPMPPWIPRTGPAPERALVVDAA